MFRRENITGILLLVLCGVVGAVMVRAIVTGERPQVSAPDWVTWVLGAIFIGGIAYSLLRSFADRRSRGGGRAWPDPMTGEKTLTDRLPKRRRDDDEA